MAQQANNAQREPSMEEILASIRRIIEDNEPPTPEPEIAKIEPAIGPAANDASPAEAFVRPVVERTPVERALAAAQNKPEKPVEPIQDMAPAAVAEPVYDIEAADAIGAMDDVEIDVEALSAAVAEETKREAESLKYAITPTTLKVDLKSAPDQPEADPAATSRGAIISDHTGRQVANAFGELSDALTSSRRRDMDDVAEEMLRPMLQDWLDNNLPVLVERLVREEIERVARGG